MALTQEDLQAIAVLLQPIREDITEMKGDIADLKGDVSALKADMSHHSHYIEPLLKTINEGVAGMIEKHERLDVVEDKVEEHDNRIFALEAAFKENNAI